VLVPIGGVPGPGYASAGLPAARPVTATVGTPPPPVCSTSSLAVRPEPGSLLIIADDRAVPSR